MPMGVEYIHAITMATTVPAMDKSAPTPWETELAISSPRLWICFVFDIKNNDVETTLYLLFNATGTLVQKGECSNNHNIDITNNPAGMYLLRIIKGDKVYSRVVVKL